MKLGTESRVKTILAVVLVGAAAYVGYNAVSGVSSPQPVTAQPASGSAAAQQAALNAAEQGPPARRVARGTGAVLNQTVDPRLRLDLLAASQNTKYEGAGRNIFAKQAEPVIEQPKVPPLVQQQQQQQQQVQNVPPPLPPINLKFFGFASRPGEPRQVFLSQNGDIFVAKEGEIVNRRYKIVRINPTFVEVEDLLNNQKQALPLQQG